MTIQHIVLSMCCLFVIVKTYKQHKETQRITDTRRLTFYTYKRGRL